MEILKLNCACKEYLWGGNKLKKNFYYHKAKENKMNREYFKDNNDPEFLYQMLGRLESDCKYFLGNGNGYEKHLWALSVTEQISAMKEIYNKLDEKPEWLTMEQIDDYENKMILKLIENKKNFIKNVIDNCR